MKNLVLLFSLVLFSGVLLAAIEPIDPPLSWKFKTHDFGKIQKDKPAEVVFEFTNESEAPIVIKQVKTSCGCTASKYPKEPIGPGQKAEITATYNAAKLGKFSKGITVYLQGEDDAIQLKIEGEVLESE